jgi:protein-S-isoprenylcysteine O-methyltransferase Ste14
LIPWILVLVGGLVHAAVLVAPAVALGLGGRLAGDPAVWTFLLLASAFYLGDAARAESPWSRRPCQAAGQRTVLLLAGMTGLALLAIFWTGLLGRAAGPARGISGLELAGAAVMLAGVALRRAAVRRLGRFFVTEVAVAPDQPLVTDGPYRWVRHPSETGTLAAALGACLLLGSPQAAAVWAAVLVPLVVWRVRIEDRGLRRAFGRRHRRYARRTGALLPGPVRWVRRAHTSFGTT